VVVSFVLHNLPAERRQLLLARAANLLTHGGTIAVLEWNLPAGRRRAAAWRRILARIEPAPSVSKILDGALSEDFSTTGLSIVLQRPLAGGRVQLLLARDARPADVAQV
jgi:hypothetical protein